MFAEIRTYRIDKKMAGLRLDKALSMLEPEVSRQYFGKLIDEGRVFVNGKKSKASQKLSMEDEIVVGFPEMQELNLEPIDMELDIAYEDDDIVIVNKPAGLAVHSDAAGNHIKWNLVSGLLEHAKGSLSGIGGVMRPGIVHRLDKDTSGLIVVAKNDPAHQELVKMFKERRVLKKYQALVCGHLKDKSGIINAPIGRDTRNRKKMAIQGINAKEAITEYRVIDEFENFELVDVILKTGRTHQIRVHFASLGHPLIGDQVYGFAKWNQDSSLQRQFLHAYHLEFPHPITKKPVVADADLPADLLDFLKTI